MTTRRLITRLAAPILLTALLAGCVAGEGSEQAAPGGAAGGSEWSDDELNIDFATYNPLSLIIKEQGWIEEDLGGDVAVTWTQSAGSNMANAARGGQAVEV